ncbi:MAG: hypothetical protein KY455_11905 [Euryarchaeota archaeon]|nr:hypothetical protein [Euryarchaeota archaeon]
MGPRVETRMSASERFSEILRILIKHEVTSLIRGIAFGPSEAQELIEHPRRVRRILEDLGPTFIKIGQLLGTRPDLVPAEYIEEFKQLYDQTSPTPYDDIKPLIESELGRPVEAVFAKFEEVPIASASIGQVHRAILRTGEEVAVKVQHPGIEAAMETDFRVLARILRFTERVFAASRVWQPVDHLEEVHHMIEKELDYRNEMRTMARVAEHFRNVADVHIPKVYPEFSSRRLMVMEFVRGYKIGELVKTKGRNGETKKTATGGVHDIVDGPTVARIITHAMAKQIFVDRLFHADPSPGNILIREDGSVSFLDWGAVGQVTQRRSRTIFSLITHLAKGDVEAVSRDIMELCDVKGEVDQKRYLHDVERLLDYYEKEEASVADPVVLDMIIKIANDHNMLLPSDFMLITRALYQFEGFCRAIDPDYELVNVLRPYVMEVMREVLYGPEKQKEIVGNLVADYTELLQRLPGRITSIMRKIEKDELKVDLELKGMSGYKKANAKNARIIAFSLLMAAVVLGNAIVLSAGDIRLVASFFFLSGLVVTVWALVMLATAWQLWYGD